MCHPWWTFQWCQFTFEDILVTHYSSTNRTQPDISSMTFILHKYLNNKEKKRHTLLITVITHLQLNCFSAWWSWHLWFTPVYYLAIIPSPSCSSQAMPVWDMNQQPPSHHCPPPKKKQQLPLGFEPRHSCLLDKHFDQVRYSTTAVAVAVV